MFKKFCLFVTLTFIQCNTLHASDNNTEYFNMLEFNKEVIDKCSIDTSYESKNTITFPEGQDAKSMNGNNFSKYGALYYTDNNKYLVDENNNYFYDWNTLINCLMEDRNYSGEYFDALNLVTKANNDENTYNINNTYINPKVTNCNLILANGVDSSSSSSNTLYNGTNLFILGTIIHNNNTSPSFVSNTNDNFVIFGPNSTWNMTTNIGFIGTGANTNIILYPGCTITDSNNNEYSACNFIFAQYNTLYLNRYLNKNSTNKLSGTIDHVMNIIYPLCITTKTNNTDIKLQVDTDNQYTCTNYFPYLYWHKDSYGHFEAQSLDNMSGAQYLSHDPELPLEFGFNNLMHENDVLQIRNKQDNPFARYDVTFWDQCSPDNSKYGLNAYNKLANINKYINVDILESLFYKGKTYKPDNIDAQNDNKGLLQYMPNEIFPGLLGKSDITVYTTKNELILWGNNSKYQGTIIIPENITDVYYRFEDFKTNKIKYKVLETQIEYDEESGNETGNYPQETKYYEVNAFGKTNRSDLKLNFHVLSDIASISQISIDEQCNHIWDIGVKGNKLENNLTNNDWKDNVIIIKDTNENKNTTLQLEGDNREFNGVIVTTPDINCIEFGKNSFVRTVNINGTPLKYYLKGDNTIVDYNDCDSIVNEDNVKFNITSNIEAACLKNEEKTLNLNVDKLNIGANSRCSLMPGTSLVIGGI